MSGGSELNDHAGLSKDAGPGRGGADRLSATQATTPWAEGRIDSQ
jgi:hypothetical protein